MNALPDVLKPGLKVVFCGTAAGKRSAVIRHYYAGRGNKFWSIIAKTKLTPRQLSPSEFRLLTRYGIGLTDLAKSVSGADEGISESEFDVPCFRSKIEHFHPIAVAFNGKHAAQQFFGFKVTYGKQKTTIGASAVFVLPSTSGAAQGFWNEDCWKQLAHFLKTRSAKKDKESDWRNGLEGFTQQ
jgi:TDG/mug DNA glycosylase family protein